MARSRVKESADDIFREIDAKIRKDAQVRSDARDFAENVSDHWRYHEAPIDTGRYAASIHVEDRPDVRGLPQFSVITRVPYAGYVEYGTEDTPEFGSAGKTAHHFGGTAP